MRISVIIPIYNAADYVQEAVESALAQPETAEVIIIEDGSQDNSLAVCQKLADTYSPVHIYRHPDGKNHGYPASTNLGILKSTCEHIAFLDADDFYLPGRFSVPSKLFAADPEIEGVYEAIGSYVEDEAAAKRWEAAGRPFKKLATVTEQIPSEQLFASLVKGGVGDFSTNGLIVKRTVFDKTGYYDEHLRLHQDTAMNIKMAAVAKLAPGRLDEPVALFRVHMDNRISAPRPQSEVYKRKMMCWETLWRWSKENLDKDGQQILLDLLLRRAMFTPRFNRTFPQWAHGLQKRIQLILLLLEHPALVREASLWKYFFPNPRYWVGYLQDRIAQSIQTSPGTEP